MLFKNVFIYIYFFLIFIFGGWGLMSQIQVKISFKCKPPVLYSTDEMSLYQFLRKERNPSEALGIFGDTSGIKLVTNLGRD